MVTRQRLKSRQVGQKPEVHEQIEKSIEYAYATLEFNRNKN